MRRPTGTGRPAALLAAIAVAVALATSCRTAAPGRPPLQPTPSLPSPDTTVAGPTLRVGILADVPRVSVSAEGEVTVWLGTPGQAGSHRTTLTRASFAAVATAAPSAAPGPRFRVQVASLSQEAAARQASAQVRETSGLAPTVSFNPDTRTYQVRVGGFASREEARALASRLGLAGLGGAFVVEQASAAGEARMRLVETDEEVQSATLVPLRSDDLLTVDGSAYRGLIEVRAGEGGSLTVVNVVNLEDYLRGVVPNELSPQSFPQIEALKAQAVAARTYALRNRGQFRSKGYDICATPACQVYKGRSTEDPLADRAVAETRGVVLSWSGQLINALYTSTCGGHTEDGANIFEGEAAPYLKGVICAPERSAVATLRTAAPAAALGEEPGLARDVALLVALGVLQPRSDSAAALKGIASEAELRDWTARLVEALRRRGCESGVEPPLNRRAAFFEHLVGSLCWQERARRLVSPQDAEYLLQVEDRADLSPGERLAAALLLQEGVLAPSPDNRLRPGSALTRVQAVQLLARIAERAGAPGLVAAEFRSAAAGEIVLKRSETAETLPLDSRFRLFRAFEGARLAASEVTLAAGDKVSYVLKDGRVAFLEAQQGRAGAAADRTSRYNRWEVRLTPAELAQMAARYAKVGIVRDVVPRRIGVSGRVIELAIVGSEGEAVLRGLKIRWALGLRENLFVVDRELDARGVVQRFVFTGKGWGHGVGLCQVGAYGMALAGADYRDILRHYYTGVAIEKSYW